MFDILRKLCRSPLTHSVSMGNPDNHYAREEGPQQNDPDDDVEEHNPTGDELRKIALECLAEKQAADAIAREFAAKQAAKQAASSFFVPLPTLLVRSVQCMLTMLASRISSPYSPQRYYLAKPPPLASSATTYPILPITITLTTVVPSLPPLGARP
eukprot:3778982-Pyramimonas_sp.AAC.1